MDPGVRRDDRVRASLPSPAASPTASPTARSALLLQLLPALQRLGLAAVEGLQEALAPLELLRVAGSSIEQALALLGRGTGERGARRRRSPGRLGRRGLPGARGPCGGSAAAARLAAGSHGGGARRRRPRRAAVPPAAARPRPFARQRHPRAIAQAIGALRHHALAGLQSLVIPTCSAVASPRARCATARCDRRSARTPVAVRAGAHRRQRHRHRALQRAQPAAARRPTGWEKAPAWRCRSGPWRGRCRSARPPGCRATKRPESSAGPRVPVQRPHRQRGASARPAAGHRRGPAGSANSTSIGDSWVTTAMPSASPARPRRRRPPCAARRGRRSATRCA